MATLTLKPKYLELIPLFGSLEETVEQAVEDYLIRRITERVEAARQEVHTFSQKYGMSYPQFTGRIREDDAFVQQLWASNPLWEDDLMLWEYYDEVLSDWKGRLKNISSN